MRRSLVRPIVCIAKPAIVVAMLMCIGGCGSAARGPGGTRLNAPEFRAAAARDCVPVAHREAVLFGSFGAGGRSLTRADLKTYLASLIDSTRGLDAKLAALHGPSALEGAVTAILAKHRAARQSERTILQSLASSGSGDPVTGELAQRVDALTQVQRLSPVIAARVNLPAACVVAP